MEFNKVSFLLVCLLLHTPQEANSLISSSFFDEIAEALKHVPGDLDAAALRNLLGTHEDENMARACIRNHPFANNGFCDCWKVADFVQNASQGQPCDPCLVYFKLLRKLVCTLRDGALSPATTPAMQPRSSALEFPRPPMPLGWLMTVLLIARF